uniref:6-phosphogluconolactonase n=1 Tax=Eiseniibacteriota bacterium TaxID=2212470 RepID=A0A832ICK5_UNCEI
MTVARFATPAAAAEAAAAAVAAAARAAVAARGVFHLALSGGRSVVPLHRRLAAGGLGVPWAATHVWFADERAVPPGDPASNLRAVRETLLDALGLAPGGVHPMDGARDDLAAAARDYAAALPEPLDLVVLGVGEDGHVASLFPGSAQAADDAARVAAVTGAPKPPARRLTLGPAALRAARGVIVMASGAEKAAAVAAALAPHGDARAVPARLVRERSWFVDAAAAARLGPAPP